MPELSLLACTPRTRNAKVRVAELAERQWGVVARFQLEESGLEAAGISRWINEHRLHRIHPGVYAVGHRALGIEGRLAAALFYAGPGAVLFGVTAGYWWGMFAGEPKRMHVAIPGRRRSRPSVRVHEQRNYERVWHKRLPLTPPAQTLLEIATQVRMMELRRALAEAEYQRLVTLDEVRGVLGRGKPGSAALRVTMECHNPRLARTKSKLEDLLISLCERYSVIPPGGVNVVVAEWLVDAVWFEQKVVVELDGYAAHSTPARLHRDHRRDLDLRAAGFVVLRYTWHQLMHEPERVVADLRRALEK
jgi:predicted transcriptional regulator of viral defense system